MFLYKEVNNIVFFFYNFKLVRATVIYFMMLHVRRLDYFDHLHLYYVLRIFYLVLWRWKMTLKDDAEHKYSIAINTYIKQIESSTFELQHHKRPS